MKGLQKVILAVVLVLLMCAGVIAQEGERLIIPHSCCDGLMLIGYLRQRVYLAVGATDMRKQVDGLAAIIQPDFDLCPFEPCLFAFCNQQRNSL